MNYSDPSLNLTDATNLKKDELEQIKDKAKIEKLAKKI